MIAHGSDVEFKVEHYKRLADIPFDLLDRLPFSAYLIDYNWKYLFLNANSRVVFGDIADELPGKSALEFFTDPKFQPIFDKLKNGVENRLACNLTAYSPLRGKQVNIKGYPLEDCYFFSTSILPAKDEILADLRDQLKKEKTR
jgi:hypothetical protein